MEKPDYETACLDAIHHWLRITDLAEFAELRHGHRDSNGGFGIAFPGDLDEYDRFVEGHFIPPNYVVIYGFWGPPEGYELFVPEEVYLTILARVLGEEGFVVEADRVRALLLPNTRA
ncbi:Uncharacterized protein OS=Vibrio orientalis CIP 102891 = ATCC 33934 GN=VIOR3934_17192 PE=4 SV=1 [Gemmata massiliana]|uniref:Uncharacterized protein n=1 Tax=Gemmata massiliana TaxID=1210884 RepID=A0A6P2D172_9BACT|nr:hypothetical protein [Gemmata massiliana]VTR95011.1 Uncharacterized protein OS=Vibrio orientalis CIP 102891 = ATCC 33934 GN=VIOR3934_17192 PE=4 SV=1 [Gemmata massiliana]